MNLSVREPRRAPLRCLIAVSLAAVTVIGCAPGNRAPRRPVSLTYNQLLSELTNVNAMATSPFGTSHMLSSYDREGGNQDWASHVPPRAGDQSVDLLSVQGKGIIRRIWMTGQYPQGWKFYIDGHDAPAIENIDHSGATVSGYHHLFAKLQNMVSGGYTSYVPIPFAKSIRITVPADSKPSKRYFQINYDLLPTHVQLAPFPREPNAETLDLATHVAETWSSLSDTLAVEADLCTNVTSKTLQPGERACWLDQSGSAQLSTWWLELTHDEGESVNARNEALRDVSIEFQWDGDDGPSVDVPVGDFFCNGLRCRRFSSLALGRIDERFVCRFPMPFAQRAKATLVNGGQSSVTLRVGWRLTELTHPPASMRYFHAAFSQTSSPNQPASRPHCVCRLRGRGHYVATYLNAIGMDPDWNILEGDESVLIDGERTPRLHGTGLEDYFNGAWYYFGLSDLATAGLLEKAAMQTSQYRYHFPDKIAFDSSLEFDFEFGHVPGSHAPPNTSRGYISSVSYWYQEDPVRVPAPPSVGQRRLPANPLETATLMSGLLELEHAGLFQEARERALEYAKGKPKTPLHELMELRAYSYDLLSGQTERAFVALKRTATTGNTDTSTGKFAAALLAPYGQPGMALLHVGTTANFQCYVDGAPVLSGKEPRQLHTTFLRLAPGDHELIVETSTPGQTGSPWLSASIQHGNARLHFTTNWSYCVIDGPTARAADIADADWIREATLPYYHTRMDYWALTPNPFVDVQSQPMQRLKRDRYGKTGQLRVAYRQRFTL